MLPPHELKNKKFPLALRGYAQTEVNEHIDFIIEKYTELYRKNDELERELLGVKARLEELEAKEDAINRALVSAQRIQERIVSDAEKQAKTITDAAKRDVAAILGSFAEKIKEERTALHALMQSVSEFRSSMLDQYQKQISEINAISPDDADPEWDKSDSEYIGQVMRSIRRAAENYESIEEPSDPENEVEIEFPARSEGMGEFSGLPEDKVEEVISTQVKKKRPKPARTIRSKKVDKDQNDSKNDSDVNGNENTPTADNDPIATDEELKRLFSDDAK